MSHTKRQDGSDLAELALYKKIELEKEKQKAKKHAYLNFIQTHLQVRQCATVIIFSAFIFILILLFIFWLEYMPIFSELTYPKSLFVDGLSITIILVLTCFIQTFFIYTNPVKTRGLNFFNLLWRILIFWSSAAAIAYVLTPWFFAILEFKDPSYSTYFYGTNLYGIFYGILYWKNGKYMLKWNNTHNEARSTAFESYILNCFRTSFIFERILKLNGLLIICSLISFLIRIEKNYFIQFRTCYSLSIFCFFCEFGWKLAHFTINRLYTEPLIFPKQHYEFIFENTKERRQDLIQLLALNHLNKICVKPKNKRDLNRAELYTHSEKFLEFLIYHCENIVNVSKIRQKIRIRLAPFNEPPRFYSIDFHRSAFDFMANYLNFSLVDDNKGMVKTHFRQMLCTLVTLLIYMESEEPKQIQLLNIVKNSIFRICQKFKPYMGQVNLPTQPPKIGSTPLEVGVFERVERLLNGRENESY